MAAPALRGARRRRRPRRGGPPHRAGQDDHRAAPAPCPAAQRRSPQAHRVHRRSARNRGPDGRRDRGVDRPDRRAASARPGVRRVRSLPRRAPGRARGAARGARRRRGVAPRPGASRGRGRDGGHDRFAAPVHGLRRRAVEPAPARRAARTRRGRRARRGPPRTGDGDASWRDCGAPGRRGVSHADAVCDRDRDRHGARPHARRPRVQGAPAPAARTQDPAVRAGGEAQGSHRRDVRRGARAPHRRGRGVRRARGGRNAHRGAARAGARPARG